MSSEDQHDDRPQSPPMFSVLRGADDWGSDSRLGAILRWAAVLALLALIGYLIFATG